MSTDLTLSKVQISKIIRTVLSKLAGPLIKEAIPLAENILAALGVTAAASVIDAGFQKKIHGSRRPLSSAPWNSTLITSNQETNDIMKTVQALEDSNILFKGVTKIIKNQTKEHKGEFLSMLSGTLGASLLVDILASKAVLVVALWTPTKKE